MTEQWRTEILVREGKWSIQRWPDRKGLLICGRAGRRRIRVSTKTDDLDEAKRHLDDLVIANRTERDWPARDPLLASVDWGEIALLITRRARYRATARKHEFDLDARYVHRLMKETGFRCAVSGIPFSRRKNPTERHPWSPSIDRIDNSHGYTEDNIRVVCVAANLAMGPWGLDLLLRLARGVVRTAQAVAPEPDVTDEIVTPEIISLS